jgi:hypothetical protein
MSYIGVNLLSKKRENAGKNGGKGK